MNLDERKKIVDNLIDVFFENLKILNFFKKS